MLLLLTQNSFQCDAVQLKDKEVEKKVYRFALSLLWTTEKNPTNWPRERCWNLRALQIHSYLLLMAFCISFVNVILILNSPKTDLKASGTFSFQTFNFWMWLLTIWKCHVHNDMYIRNGMELHQLHTKKTCRVLIIRDILVTLQVSILLKNFRTIKMQMEHILRKEFMPGPYPV